MNARERLHRGKSVPAFFYGTAWKEERTEALASLAIAQGFAAIDTANQRKHYLEAAVGAAVAGCGLPRERLFLQTKFTYARGQDERLPYDPRAANREQVAQSFASSLDHLQTERIDSYLLHGPETGYGLSAGDWEVWRAMEALLAAGQAQLIGVSNVSVEQLARLCEKAEIAPAFVQNRCFAINGWDAEVRALCRERDILYQGFSLLTANAPFLRAPAIARAAAARRKTPAQVVFRFALEVGMIPLTGTSDAAHMAEDLACFDFTLDPGEVRAIEKVAG